MTPLHPAASQGHPEATKLLLSHGADIDTRCEDYGASPLHWAAQEGQVEVTKLLLSHGADMKSKRKNGYRPLHSAASEGQVETTRLLVTHGADINTNLEGAGLTPLCAAALKDYKAIA